MKRIFLLAFLLSALIGAEAIADRPTKILGPGLGSGRTIYHQTVTDRVLNNDTTYILTGIYIVDSLETITIPPGTVVLGDTGGGGGTTLMIGRGGQIFAEGTATCPIVFTSIAQPGQRSAGDWGGIVILGKAPTNQANPVIEGGLLPGTYGGGGVGLGDPNDNSGVFKYVRIEYPGYRFQLNNEVNGLTMGGVGRGTEIHHVQVSFSNDDSYEWFGGTVDCNNLVAYSGWDDEFDTDFGYVGRLQYVFGLRDPLLAELSGVGQSNGFESDNEGTASSTEPRTHPLFSNVTLVGPRRNDGVAIPTTPQVWEYVAVVRRGSELSVYNSVLMGYKGGYSLRDNQSMLSAQANDLQSRGNSIQEDGTLNSLHTSGTIPPGFDVVTWWNTAAYNNDGAPAANNDRLPSTIGLVNMSSLTNPDPRPGVGSEPATAGTEWTDLNALAPGYFDNVSYRGAFDPSLALNAQWTAGWTNFDPQNFNVNGFTVSDLVAGWNIVAVDRTPASFAQSALYPNALSMWEYNEPTGTYINRTGSTLVNGEGYWLNAPAAECVNITGASLASVMKSTGAAGWTLVGSASSPADYPADVNITGGTALSGPWFFNGSAYSVVSVIKPGVGYWFNVSAPSTITITP